MANKRPVDRTKKSNIKCEHCKHWNGGISDVDVVCNISGKVRNYYNRCKSFEWREET